MAEITTVVPPFTKVPDIADPVNFEADGNTFLNEINERYIAGNLQVSEMNAVRNEVNTFQTNTSGYNDTTLANKNLALQYKDLSLVYKTASELAYNNTTNLVNNLVIPTTATYSYAEADVQFVAETENFLNFKIGE